MKTDKLKFSERNDLYENKLSTGEEAAQSRAALEKKVEKAGYKVVTAIGNVKR